MNKRIINFFLCCLGCAVFAGCQDDPVEQLNPDNIQVIQEENNIVPGMVRVKFKPEADLSALETSLASADGPVTKSGFTVMDLVSGKYRIKSMQRVFPPAGKFEVLHRKHGLHLWYELQLDTNLNTRSATIDYGMLDIVDIAVPVYKMSLYDNTKAVPAEEVNIQSVSTRSTKPFNDPLLKNQWHYDEGDQLSASILPEANIGLFPAWEKCTGDPDVIVAVIDDGIMVDHEDLAANMWVNEGEIPGNGIDDDVNGYTDDIYGYNFQDRKGTIVPGGDHGSHVAGTIAAVNNNGIGVCGIAGGDYAKGVKGARVMSCQIFSGNATDGSKPAAFAYAADMGAVIAQCSWGFNQANITDPAIEDAIRYFIEEAGKPELHPNSPMQGGVAIFASGNEGASAPYFPGAYDICIAVTATDYLNQRASSTRRDHQLGNYYANIGSYVNLAAPGGMNESGLGVLSLQANGGYGYMNGTSMACPHVSGIAALIIAMNKNTGFTSEKLKDILLSSVLDLSDYDPEFYRYMGKGLARADIAVNPNDGVGPDRVTDLTVTAEGNSCTLNWTVTADPGDGTPLLYRIYYSITAITVENYLSVSRKQTFALEHSKVGDACRFKIDNLEETVWYFAIVGEDRWGNFSVLSNVVTHAFIAPDEAKIASTMVGDYATLSVGKNFSGTLIVCVYDAAGNRVTEQKFDAVGRLQVNMSGLLPGIYTLKLTSDGPEKTFRIVKK